MNLKKLVPYKVRIAINKGVKFVATHLRFVVIVTILGGLSWMAFSVNQILDRPTDTEYQAQKVQGTIGHKFGKKAQETIELIRALHKSDEVSSQPLILPPGRVNPFAE